MKTTVKPVSGQRGTSSASALRTFSRSWLRMSLPDSDSSLSRALSNLSTTSLGTKYQASLASLEPASVSAAACSSLMLPPSAQLYRGAGPQAKAKRNRAGRNRERKSPPNKKIQQPTPRDGEVTGSLELSTVPTAVGVTLERGTVAVATALRRPFGRLR